VEGARADRLEAARRVDYLVANSVYTARAPTAPTAASRARACWLGTESGRAAAAAAERAAGRLVLGRLEPGRDKGHAALIDVWAKVVSAVPDARLLIVGGGPDLIRPRSGGALARRGAHRGRRFVPDEAMPRVGPGDRLRHAEPRRRIRPGLHRGDAPWRTRRRERSRRRPRGEPDGETGYNVDLARPADLTDRLVQLLRDRDLATRLGAAGQRRWAQHFATRPSGRAFCRCWRTSSARIDHPASPMAIALRPAAAVEKSRRLASSAPSSAACRHAYAAACSDHRAKVGASMPMHVSSTSRERLGAVERQVPPRPGPPRGSSTASGR
jgi:hypothetical protein